jgi:hypothetical protein
VDRPGRACSGCFAIVTGFPCSVALSANPDRIDHCSVKVRVNSDHLVTFATILPKLGRNQGLSDEIAAVGWGFKRLYSPGA